MLKNENEIVYNDGYESGYIDAEWDLQKTIDALQNRLHKLEDVLEDIKDILSDAYKN